MSTGKDLVQVAKDGYEIYKAAKELKESVDEEKKIAAGEIKALQKRFENLEALLKDLPGDVDRKDRGALVSSTLKTIRERISYQEELQNFEELAKLHAQTYILNSQLLKLDLLDRFDVRGLISSDELGKLLDSVREAQAQVVTGLVARGFVRIATRFAIFAIDLAVLVAKAAG